MPRPKEYTLFYTANDGDNPPEFTEFFYDGALKVYDGIVKVPKNQEDWVARLLIIGYRLSSRRAA
jgi:hypothetical protein